MADSSTLTSLIVREIEASGPILFSRFMEMALYQPEKGYYCRDFRRVGIRGDFVTSVTVGNIFGELLSEFFRISQVDIPLMTKERLHLVEVGAHDGQLARDILNYFSNYLPELSGLVHYLIVEPSCARRTEQEERLKPYLDQVSWVGSWNEVEESSLTGFIFSNELLDAFPVDRVRWSASEQGWIPWRVAVEEGELVWHLSLDHPIPDYVSEFTDETPTALRPHLPDGFTTELSPGACRWWQTAAKRLRRGFLMAVDYGLKQEEFFAPHRAEGTLRAYYRQRQSTDLLAHPGEQDLTAHVNFSTIEAAGLSAGLVTRSLQSQESFFMAIMQRLMSQQPNSVLLTPDKLKAFQTLVHPSHFGRSFSVLTQQKT